MKMKSTIPKAQSVRSRFTSRSIAILVVTLALAGAALAAPSEDDRIWRVQIQLQTANVDDAGTDDSVRVRLNPANSTWLDYGRDDFPRNNTFTYDLKMDGVSTISDLQYIYISKTGTDGLCLTSFALIVNGREIYTRTFPGAGHWLDNDGDSAPGYLIFGSAMRSDDAWIAYTQPFPPLTIPRAEMESRIEAMVGDFAHGNRLYWGHKYGRAYVEVSKKAQTVSTLHADLDLSADVFGFDPEVDVDFDIEIGCVNGQITLDTKNVKVVVDSDWYAEILSLGIYEFIDNYVNGKLAQALKGLDFGQIINVPFCPRIEVDNDGNINFTLPGNGAPIVVGNSSTTQVEEGQSIADGAGPLELNINSAEEVKTDEATAYTLLVKSNSGEALKVNVQVELPTLIALADAVVEAGDAGGKRMLMPQITTGENGRVLLSFDDRLEAGAVNRYSLSLQFRYAPEADLRIDAMAADEGGGSAIRSATHFRMEDGVAKARGTFQAAKATKAARVPSKE